MQRSATVTSTCADRQAQSPRAPRRRRQRVESLPGRTLEIFRAVPVGSRRARDQMGWVAAVLAHPELAGWRADRVRNLAEIARVLARYADWRMLTTRPTWARIAEQSGVGRATVARAIRWLRTEGFLGVVESGTTPAFRPGVLHGLADLAEGNRASEYVLTIPTRSGKRQRIRTEPPVARPITDTPSLARKGQGRRPPHAREAAGQIPRHWPLSRSPRTRGQMLAAAEQLRQRCRLLSRITARHLRSLLADYWRQGWTPGDCLHALDHQPSGRLWPHTYRVRRVPGWLRHRLAAWHAPGGRLYPSPSQLAAEHARRIRTEQHERRAQWAAQRARAAATDHASHVARARKLLAAVRSPKRRGTHALATRASTNRRVRASVVAE
jgi:hypothetical protein